jgi:hypothetical protein
MIEAINIILLVAAFLLGPIGFILIVVGLIKAVMQSKFNRPSAYILVGGIASIVLMCISCMLIAVIPETVEHGTITVCEMCDDEISSTVEKVNVSKSSDIEYEVTTEQGLCDECSRELRDLSLESYEEGNWGEVVRGLGMVAKYKELSESDKQVLTESTCRNNLGIALEKIESGENLIKSGDYESAMRDFSDAMILLADIKDEDSELARELEVDTHLSKATKLNNKADRLVKEQQEAAEIIIRELYETTLRTHYLEEGLNIKVKVYGPKSENIKLTYVLFNEVWVYNFRKGELITEMRELGFERVTLSDGYGSSWWFDLQ